MFGFSLSSSGVQDPRTARECPSCLEWSPGRDKCVPPDEQPKGPPDDIGGAKCPCGAADSKWDSNKSHCVKEIPPTKVRRMSLCQGDTSHDPRGSRGKYTSHEAGTSIIEVPASWDVLSKKHPTGTVVNDPGHSPLLVGRSS